MLTKPRASTGAIFATVHGFSLSSAEMRSSVAARSFANGALTRYSLKSRAARSNLFSFS
jgi:hypothetical protein